VVGARWRVMPSETVWVTGNGSPERLDTPLLFAAVVVLPLLGVLLFNIVAWIERSQLPLSRVATEVVEYRCC